MIPGESVVFIEDFGHSSNLFEKKMTKIVREKVYKYI